MIIRLLTLIAPLCIAISASAFGSSAAPTSRSSCMEDSAGIIAELFACLARETETQDVRVDSNFRIAANASSAERRKQLLESQRAWLRYRDATCAFYADPTGGYHAVIDTQDCLLRETAARADDLQRLMN
jgi:uncharacterized protein YecT (DUF1311 family)